MVVRVAAVLVVLTALSIYYGVSESLVDLTVWGDVAFVGLLLMPAFFVLPWLALPLWRAAPPGVLTAAIVVRL